MKTKENLKKEAVKRFEKIYHGTEKGKVSYLEDEISFREYAEGYWFWDWAGKPVNLEGEDWTILIVEDEDNIEFGFKAEFYYKGKTYDLVPLF